jgi:uncharacterized membrane-anchored protein
VPQPLALHAITLLHVVAGTFVLAVAPAAMIARKGGRWHRGWGIAFTTAMAFVLATAVFMWQAHGHLFLLFLDAVSAYLVFTGYRTISRRRRRAPDSREDHIDTLVAGGVAACAAVLVWLAVAARTPLVHDLAPVLVALACIALAFVGLDLKALFERRQSRLGSLLMHLSAMIGAYISAVTAFVVINAHGVPMGLRWLVPSVVGTVAIAAFSIVYRRRFAGAPVPTATSVESRSGDTSLIPMR